ncbi:hypothetical protein C1H46_018775 [Malus baccata]|uniref:Uncharacterized protein n=1 Tax=Malus baccata TaxID=106549 RepID=A0A540MA57_MALBA|nr:hypothetical protein C1H46_018775 [Malus baccata]
MESLQSKPFSPQQNPLWILLVRILENCESYPFIIYHTTRFTDLQDPHKENSAKNRTPFHPTESVDHNKAIESIRHNS